MNLTRNMKSVGFLLIMYFNVGCTLFEINVYEDDLNYLPFEHAYPRHLRAKKAESSIVVDGKLDEPEWNSAIWDSQFVDITSHENKSLNEVPKEFQTAISLLWDEDYLYVGVRLKQPFIYGNITGHNLQAPYHDNDFEVFVDVSGTTEYYKEFEMNTLNATYDVNWGVPDNAGLSCDDTNDGEKEYLPVCVNTTFPGYSGNWTMKDIRGSDAAVNNKGLKTATDFDENTFAKYIEENEWTLEIAFPIQRSEYNGGLLDTFGDDISYEKYHPKHANEMSLIPLYWWIDFARAEHPREYTSSSGIKTTPSKYQKFCPLDCDESLNTYLPSLDNPDAEQCEFLQEKFPTLLGTNPVYGCYFEWVYQALGWRNNYMHRPMEWAMLEFSDDDQDCRNIEFVGRHAVKLIYLAEVEYKRANGIYSSELNALIDPRYCLEVQDCEDLQTILDREDVFTDVKITVINDIPVLNQYCTSRPCFTVRLQVSVPVSSKRHVYITRINENMKIAVEHSEFQSTSQNNINQKLCF